MEVDDRDGKSVALTLEPDAIEVGRGGIDSGLGLQLGDAAESLWTRVSDMAIRIGLHGSRLQAELEYGHQSLWAQT